MGRDICANIEGCLVHAPTPVDEGEQWHRTLAALTQPKSKVTRLLWDAPTQTHGSFDSDGDSGDGPADTSGAEERGQS